MLLTFSSFSRAYVDKHSNPQANVDPNIGPNGASSGLFAHEPSLFRREDEDDSRQACTCHCLNRTVYIHPLI